MSAAVHQARMQIALSIAILGSLTVLAAARDYQKCQPSALPPAQPASAQLNNFGMNSLVLYVCNSSDTSACSIANSFPCELTAEANSTMFVQVYADVTAMMLQYFVSEPFNWHAIESTPPYLVPWPPKAAGDPIVNVSYPAPGATLCDSTADCPSGVQCVTSPSPARCSSAVPSASPAAPSPLPVPSPPSGPAANACNLTNQAWEQPHVGAAWGKAHGLGHSADAFINFNSTAGVLTFTCTSGHALCPFNTSHLNGTVQLSAVDHGFSLQPYNSSYGQVSGIINSTLSCQTMTVLSPGPAVQWTFVGPKPAPQLNLDVTMASFLGQATATAGASHGGTRGTVGATGGQFVATGVVVLSAPTGSPALIAVVGNGQADFGVTAETILGAAQDSNGAIVLITADVTKGRGSGGTMARVIKVGDRIDHIRSNDKGSVAIAGSFGVASLTGLATSGAITVAWHDDLADVEPGTCGVCCSTNGNANDTCRVDIGQDDVVIVDLAVTSAAGDLWAAYSPTGTRFAQMVQPASSLDSVVVDSSNSRLLIGWFYDSNTGKEPMVMPRVTYYGYDLSDFSKPVVRAFEDFPWDAHVYRTPGQPCNGDVADGRVMGLRYARDGTLLFMGRSDGGDSPFQCGMRDSTRVTPMAQIDGYTSAYNMQAQAITNFLRVDPATGETIVAQMQLARLPSNQKGNTLLTLAGQADSAGNVYLLQSAGCCIANMGNLTVNGQPLAGPTDSTALHILSPSLETRYHWSHFIAPGSAGRGGPVDIDVRGNTVALVMTTNAAMVTAGALPNTGPNVGGQPVGYLVLLPTVSSGGSSHYQS